MNITQQDKKIINGLKISYDSLNEDNNQIKEVNANYERQLNELKQDKTTKYCDNAQQEMELIKPFEDSDKENYIKAYLDIVNKYSEYVDAPESLEDYYTDAQIQIMLKCIETETFEAPFVTVYGDVDRGKPLIRLTDGHVQLAINYGNFASTYGLKVGDLVVIKLKEKGTYKSELEIRHLVRTNNRADYDSDEVFANFREVRLGSIGQGKLYRSSHPSINDPRAPYASKLMENVGIKTVINLSDSQDELLKNLQYSNYYKSIYDNGNLIALNMGVDPMSDDFAQKLQTGLLFMISKEPPYLLHCVEGKDRAGIVTALLGAIMDASTEEIYADYVKSYENYYKVQYGTAAYDAVKKIISDLFVEINDGKPVVDSNVKQVAMKYLTEKVGLTPEQIAQLQGKLK